MNQHDDSEKSNQFNNGSLNKSRGSQYILVWMLRLTFVCLTAVLIFFRCKLEVSNYTVSMFFVAILTATSWAYLIRRSEVEGNRVVRENWHAAQEAHKHLQHFLKVRGIGGVSPSVFDYSSSISSALGTVFTLLILITLGLMFTATRIFEGPHECSILDFKQIGILVLEVIVWSFTMVSGGFLIFKGRNK